MNLPRLDTLELITLAIKIENEQRDKTKIEERAKEISSIRKYLEFEKNLFENASKGEYISCNDLFSNPMVESVKKIYNFSLEDYRITGRTKITDFASDIHTGIEMILQEFNRFEKSPESLKSKDYDLLKDVCFKLTEWTQNLQDTGTRYRLAA